MSPVPEISVLVPAYNESASLPELVARVAHTFSRLGKAGEIVVVDDGSTDATARVLEGLARENPSLVVVRHAGSRGVCAAWESGLERSRAPIVATLDADLQYRPEDIARLHRELVHHNADLVCGWRSPVGKRGGRHGWENRAFRWFLRRLLGVPLKDTRTGFLVARRRVFEELLAERRGERFFHAFVSAVAVLRGDRVVETEVWFSERRVGTNRFGKLAPGLLGPLVKDALRVWWRHRVRRRRSSPLEGLLASPGAHDRGPAWGVFRKAWFRLYMATFPLHHWMMTRKAGKYFWQLRRTQWADPADLKAYQERRLRELVGHAYRHVPFYRARMDAAGVKPEDVRTLEDLGKLPFLSKTDIRENLYFDLMSDNHDKREIYRITTSGSTGEPLVMYADRVQLELRWAATLRSQEWAGYRFGDRCARLWHQTIGMSPMQVFKEKFDAWFTRRLFIPAYEMSDENIRSFVRKMEGWRPAFVDGYAESFNFLSTYLKHSELKGLKLRGMMSSAQSLPAHSREKIEASFGCRVFDKYGSREFSGIAYECDAHEGHHVVAELYLVEVLKEGRPCAPGEIGEIVITDLNNFCMPLIRYRIGDLAVAMDPSRPCLCGRSAPRIGEIQGRTQSIIMGTHGRYLPGTFFAHVFKDFDHVVRQYQIVQEKRDRLSLVIIKGPQFTEEGLGQILEELKRYVGADMHIDVEFTDRIAMVRTGKHRATISSLTVDFQAEKAAPAPGLPAA
jgi:phenylacetate-CoA ligase